MVSAKTSMFLAGYQHSVNIVLDYITATWNISCDNGTRTGSGFNENFWDALTV